MRLYLTYHKLEAAFLKLTLLLNVFVDKLILHNDKHDHKNDNHRNINDINALNDCGVKNVKTIIVATSEIENYPEEGDQLLNILVKVGLTTSRGEGRRLIEQGGLSVDGEKVTDPNIVITKAALVNGIKIKKGKKVFQKVIAK